MAKDDYFVIVFKILNYLYYCLKNGEEVDAEKISAKDLKITHEFWSFIIHNMNVDGLIANVVTKPNAGLRSKQPVVVKWEDISITKEGMESLRRYLV